MNGFERRKQKKMESILDAAAELFSAHGIKSVTIAEIAQKAHVSQVSIYNFFGNKNALIQEVIFRLLDIESRKYEELLKSDLPFPEKFKKIVLLEYKATDDYSSIFITSGILNEPMLQDFTLKYYETKIIPLMTTLIEQGKQEGCINMDIGTDSILLYVELFTGLLNKSDLTKKIWYDMATLFYFGFTGKPLDWDFT